MDQSPLFITPAVAARIEAVQAHRGVAYAQARAWLHPGAGAAWLEVGGGWAFHAGTGSPVYGAVGLGMAGPVAERDLDALEVFFAGHGVPPRADLCPLADGSLAALLRARGYGVERFESVLAARLPLAAPGPVGRSAIEVRRAAPAEAAAWITVSAQGFAGDDSPPEATLDLVAPNFHSAGATCVFALIGGEPAGAGSLFVDGGAAELGGASTRARFRGHGVQAALLAHRIAEAAHAGAELIVTTTAPGSPSQRNVERAGLRLAYTTAVMGRGARLT